MEMFGRREAWPAAVLLGLGLLTLGIVLKAAQANMPVDPTWIMAALAGLYLVLAFLAGQLTWRTPVVFVVMLAGHALLALLMGWGYAAVEGVGRNAYDALAHGLWDYLPGTALQFGFACVLGMVIDAHLEPSDEFEDDQEREHEPEYTLDDVPDLSSLEDPQTAVAALSAFDGVAAALLSGPEVFGGGAWERDPQAALGRIQALLSRTGSGLNAFPLGALNLLARSDQGSVAALLVSDALSQPLAHALLRELWAVGERLWPLGDDDEAAP